MAVPLTAPSVPGAWAPDSLDDAILAALGDLHAKGRPWPLRQQIVRHDAVADELERAGDAEVSAAVRLDDLVRAGMVEALCGGFRLVRR